MIKRLLLLAGVIIALGAGFAGGLALLDRLGEPGAARTSAGTARSGGDPWAVHAAGRKLHFSIRPGDKSLLPQTGGTIKPASGGVEVSSQIANPAENARNTFGAVYLPIRDDGSVLSTTQAALVAIEISRPLTDSPATHDIELNYEQAGLTGTGWTAISTVPGRNVLTLRYKPPVADTRPKPREDRIWLRADSQGRGRSIIVHEIRVYLE